MRMLFLVVAYENHAEIDRFLHMLSLDHAAMPLVDVALCDNSPSRVPLHSMHEMVRAAVARPDNPGYLAGALHALDAYISTYGDIPDWIVLTNSDLTVKPAHIADAIAHRNPTEPMILAPRITEYGVEMNPHRLRARPLWRHGLNRLLTAWVPLAYTYLWAEQTYRTIRIATGSFRRPRDLRRCGGATMHSAYGAFILFSRGFMSLRLLPRNVPLLAEEYAIAEAARRSKTPIVYEPQIEVVHVPHSTTGPSVSLSRAVLLREAFLYMWRSERQAG